MNEEQLKQEAEEYCANNCGDCYGCHKKYRKNKNCERLKSMIKTYLVVAEPREKRIDELEEVRSKQAELINKDTIRMENQKYQIEKLEKENKALGERCLQLQKDKGNLIDRCRELEAQIEKRWRNENAKDKKRV